MRSMYMPTYMLKKNISGEPWVVILGNIGLWRKSHLGLDLKHRGGELSRNVLGAVQGHHRSEWLGLGEAKRNKARQKCVCAHVHTCILQACIHVL